MLQIPLHRLPNPALKCFHRTPSQFPLDLGCIHRVTPVMSRTVLHKCNQLTARRSAAPCHLIYKVADRLHDLDVPLFIPAANVVCLSHSPSAQNLRDRFAVISHIKPVANVLPVSVNRQRFSRVRVQDHKRYQFLRELESPIIIRAVRREHRHSEGVMISTHKMVRSRLRRRVRTIRCIRSCLTECRILGPQRTIHLVCRNVQKSEVDFLLLAQPPPPPPTGEKPHTTSGRKKPPARRSPKPPGLRGKKDTFPRGFRRPAT